MDADGYDEELQQVVLEDYTAAAGGYFGGIRVPATLITGSSLGFLFAFSQSVKSWKNTNNGDDAQQQQQQQQQNSYSFWHLTIFRLYHAFVMLAFALALSTVLIATAASVTVLQGTHNPKAETAYQLLRREFNYEYCMTRWCFLMALFCFMLGVTLKLILEFHLLTNQRRYHLVALISLVVSMLSHVVSYINRTLYSWPNLWQFTLYVVHLVWQEAFGSNINEAKPLLVLSIVSFGVALVAMIKVAFFTPQPELIKSDRKAKNE